MSAEINTKENRISELTSEDIAIQFEPEKNRVAAYHGKLEVGRLTYEIEDSSWVVDHTFVYKKYRGLQIARRLVDEVVKRAEEEGVTIVPVCPYVKKVLEKKDDQPK